MLKKFSFIAILSVLLIPGQIVVAQNFTETLDNTGAAVYDSPDDVTLFGTLGIILNATLSVLGIILLIIVLYAGFLWMTAGGNEKSVEKAKDMLVNAVVGMILLVSAYAIAQFVVTQFSVV
jgi:hypothetical protein